MRLNREQASAVERAGSVLITACPGSGKTRVLAARVLRELGELAQHPHRRVLALTYTNRAADEVWSRVDESGIDSDRLWAGTIHAFCLEWILRPYSGCNQRLRRGFHVIDERRREELLSEARAEHGANRFLEVATRLGRDGRAANTDAKAIKTCAAYHANLELQKLIDFDLILSLSYSLVSSVPEIPTVLGALFRLICVDEYQDTQDLQYGILAKIVRASRGACSLFVVGDPDQAIYASLGGVARSLTEMRDEFDLPEMTELSLTGNYRSTQRIIDYCGSFRVQANRIESRASHAAERGLITLSESACSSDELPVVLAAAVRKRLADGCPENEIAILAPQWFMVTRIARQLASLLPEVSFDAPGLSPFRGCQDNIWYRVTRLILSSPSPSMYPTRVRWAREVLSDLGVQDGAARVGKAIEPRDLLRLVNSLDLSGDDGLNVLNRAFGQLSAALGLVLAPGDDLSLAQDELFATARSRLSDTHYSFPNEIQAFRRAFGRGPGVVVNTCHGAKGGEWDTVIAFGLLQGYVPHWNDIFADTNAAGASTARRLLYVISSRAKRHLHLIAESGRSTRTGQAYATTTVLRSVTYSYDPPSA